MSQNPPSGYNPDPENPYGAPPPQNPYETPSQTPYGVPPSQSPYQEYPYQVPPQAPYGAQQQNPYGVPPQSAYGTSGYDPNQSYETSSPLPLGQAVGQLPNQYIKVLTKPSAATFAAEMGKASWDILWVQLIAYAVIAGILSYLRTLIPGELFAYNTSNSVNTQVMGIIQEIALGSSFVSIIVIPVSFFIGQGITYLLAKAFGGTGTFLRQGYTYLLISVPIGIITSVVAFIPGLGGLVAFGLGVYGIVLQIFSLMSVHRLSGGKPPQSFSYQLRS
jgi:hypothetical protein